MGRIDTTCIIDDDEIAIYGLKRALQQVDFCNTCLVFKDGLEAFEKLTQMVSDKIRLPDIIFLDIHMPIMDGWEFLGEFHKTVSLKSEELPIFVMTSSVDIADFQKAENYNLAQKCLVKPISCDTLVGLLEAL